MMLCAGDFIAFLQVILSNVCKLIHHGYLPVSRTELFKRSAFYYGSTLWNALPPDIRLCKDIDKYKNILNLKKNIYNTITI